MSLIEFRPMDVQASPASVMLGIILSAGVLAAPKAQTPTFRASADLTVVDAVVTDAKGNHVTDLAADEFEVYQDGERQVIQQVVYVHAGANSDHFATPLSGMQSQGADATVVPAPGPRSAGRGLRPNEVARTIALVIDDLGLSFESTFAVRNAVHRYIDTQIAKGDLVAIVRTSGGVGALQQFTTDRRLLHKAADRVQWTINRTGISGFAVSTPKASGSYSNRAKSSTESDRATDPDSTRIGSDRHGEAENTLEGLRDSMLASASMGAIEFIIRGTQALPGRKSLILFSEGLNVFDRMGSARAWSALTRTLTMANRAGVVVYTVDPRGLQTAGLTAEDDPSFSALRSMSRTTFLLHTQESLQFIAAQTGGFAVLNTNDLNLGIGRILRDQRGYYVLGYAAKQRPTGRWEQGRIKVKIRRPGLRVRARSGVYGPSSPGDRDDVAAGPLLMAALSPFEAGDVTVRLTSLFGYEKTRESYIRSLLFIDPEGLTFTADAEGTRRAQADIVMIAAGDNGEIAGQLKRTIDLRFTEVEYERVRAIGFVYHTGLRVKRPGGYQVRAAVRDPMSGRVGSASQFVEVPAVGRRRLAVSGVLLRARETLALEDRVELAPEGTALGSPTTRTYQPGADVVYAYEIYDGLPTEVRKTLAMSTALVRDGKVLYESPLSAIEGPDVNDPLRVVPIGGVLSLGKDVRPGTYSLQVRVTRKDRSKQVAMQWVDFDVTPVPGIGLMGTDEHTERETADLTSLPTQTIRAALLIDRLGR